MRKLLVLSMLFVLPAYAQEETEPKSGAEESTMTDSPPDPGATDVETTPPAEVAPGAESTQEPAATPAENVPAQEEAPAEAADVAEGNSVPAVKDSAEPNPASDDAGQKAKLLVLAISDKGAGPQIAFAISSAMAEQAQKSFVGETVTKAALQEFLDDAALSAATGCDAEGCMAELGSKVDASRVIAGSVARTGDDLLLTILVIDPGTGKMIASEQRKTPSDPNLVQYTARNLTSLALTGHVSDQRVPVAISVSVDDPGTRLIVDGRDEGEAPKTILLLPGEHTLEATLPGYQPTEQVFTVEEATPMNLEVSLYWERFPLWPVATTLGVASAVTILVGSSMFLVAMYNYNGFFGVVPNKQSYADHTPATSSSLINASQNVLIWGWAGQLVVFAGLAIGTAAIGFEVADLIFLSFESSQGE